MAAGRVKTVFLDNLGSNNPVFVQILGICSTLAVTNALKNTAVMCAGLTFTVSLSCWTVSLLRTRIPSRIRMMVEVLIIASYVMVVDILLQWSAPDISRQLGPYVGLIVTNCIVMGRAEAFAMNQPPGLALADGFSAGLGYSYVLLAIAFIRELLGAGTLWGLPVLGANWTPWAVMTMAPGAFFVLAAFIWIVRSIKPRGAKTGSCACAGEKTK